MVRLATQRSFKDFAFDIDTGRRDVIFKSSASKPTSGIELYVKFDMINSKLHDYWRFLGDGLKIGKIVAFISMSMHESLRILEAVDILCDAPEGVLRLAFQHQRIKASLIFGKLQVFAKIDGCSVDEASSEECF